MFATYDQKDDYRIVSYTIEEAMTNAINHCVTEGLMVISIDSIVKNEITIIYTDPDDGNPYDIAIYEV